MRSLRRKLRYSHHAAKIGDDSMSRVKSDANPSLRAIDRDGAPYSPGSIIGGALAEPIEVRRFEWPKAVTGFHAMIVRPFNGSREQPAPILERKWLSGEEVSACKIDNCIDNRSEPYLCGKNHRNATMMPITMTPRAND
jgi:hypothetical protein